MPEASRIRPRERDAIIQSLRAGVVPRMGQQHIQVGRKAEVESLIDDIERVADGGSTIRFVIGDYGAGKTFFLHLVRSIALEQRLVTAHADLTPDRRIHASGGQARALYAELMANVATRTKPEGGALPSIVERFVTQAIADAKEHGVTPDAIIHERLGSLQEMVGGYDFAEVIAAYWRAYDTGDEALKSDAIRWLRAQFATRTDARNALGVRTIIDDADIWDHLKLFARFVKLAGYAGLLVCLDEMVNLFKLSNTQARRANYEQILRILNDSLQGTAKGLGMLMCGTPEFLSDTRRGLYSYEALQTRLADNAFAIGGLVDFSGPVLRLSTLTPEDIFVLLKRVTNVFAAGDSSAAMVGDEAIQAFMQHCSARIGDEFFRTPRSTVTAFVNLLSVLEQNPGVEWSDLVATANIQPDRPPDIDFEDATGLAPAAEVDDELTSFRV